VATDILGVSGRAMLTALIDGERDVHALARWPRPACAQRSPPWSRR
jgi:transposase